MANVGGHWITAEVFNINTSHSQHYWVGRTYNTNKTILIVDDVFDWWNRTSDDKSRINEIMKIHNNSTILKEFERDTDKYDTNVYPYTNLKYSVSDGIGNAEIRSIYKIVGNKQQDSHIFLYLHV